MVVHKKMCSFYVNVHENLNTCTNYSSFLTCKQNFLLVVLMDKVQILMSEIIDLNLFLHHLHEYFPLLLHQDLALVL